MLGTAGKMEQDKTQQSLNADLFDGIDDVDIEKVGKSISAGADINALTSHRQTTPLSYAMARLQYEKDETKKGAREKIVLFIRNNGGLTNEVLAAKVMAHLRQERAKQ